jgi:ligand-binding SRPBCC domain-containing protein
MHVLAREQRIPRPRDEVFAFFSDAANLQRITPPALGFRILTPQPIAMRAGATIDYRLSLSGLPFRWRTLIEAWEPPVRFVDVQERGPYRLWRHTHTFEELDAGSTLMRDRVEYALPFGPLGEVARRLFVARQLERIFAFRNETVMALLGAAPADATLYRPAGAR